MAEKKQIKNKKETKKKVEENVAPITMDQIDYKNVKILQRYTNGRRKIVPRKYTKLSSKLQRKLANEVKKARFVGLLKYTERH